MDTIRIAATELRYMPTSTLIPYINNARTHPAEQIEQLRRSLREFGFVTPILVDSQGNVIAGHGRLVAAQTEGMSEVPCVIASELTDEQRRAYILADNRLAETSAWDPELLNIELNKLQAAGFDLSVSGFDIKVPDNNEWFENRKCYDNEGLEEESEEYREFIDKHTAKRTTDDCYTPDAVYKAVADWVAQEYDLDQRNFVRPFYPGGDYQSEKYTPLSIVVDNPPFSITAEIVKFYTEHNIRFFLFCHGLTPLNSATFGQCTVLAVGNAIEFENGALITISFITNIESEYAIRSAPSLYAAVSEAAKKTQKAQHKQLPKYVFPPEVCTASMVSRYSKYGIDFKVRKGSCVRISKLESMEESEKTIFGSGLLISERAAAERAAAERAAAERAAATLWPLSEKEKEIVRNLN